MADQEQDELVTVLGIEIDKQKFKSSLKSIQDFGTNVKSLKTGMSLLNPELTAMEGALGAIAAAGAAFIAGDLFAGHEAKNISQLKTQADLLGITANQLQALQLAAKNSNIDVAQVTGVIGSLREQLLGFQTGNPPTKLMESLAKASSLLGVSISPIEKNGKIKSAYELFTQVAEAIGKIHDKTKQAAASQLIFGQNLTPLLSHGMQGINQAYQALGSHNLFIKPTDIAQMKAFNQQMNMLGAEFGNLKMRLAESLIPVLSQFNKLLEDPQFINGMIAGIKLLAYSLEALFLVINKMIQPFITLNKLAKDFNNPSANFANGDILKNYSSLLTSALGVMLPGVAIPSLSSGTTNTTTNNASRSTTNVHIGQSPRSFMPAYAIYGNNR